MKSTGTLLLALFLFVAVSAVENAPAQAAARTDVYHVYFAKAALGKGAENATKTAKIGTMQSSKHLGTTATVTAAGNPPPGNARDLNAWHTDTFANGPAWPDFAKAMGLDDAAKSAGSVYVVSVYRAAPGHRDELEKSLAQLPSSTGGIAGNVLMQHLEGGPWHYLAIARYNSWQDFATSEKSSVADTLKPDGGWLAICHHSTYHNDTITDRIAP